MMADLEKVKLLIGEENYNLLLKNGYFPIEIDTFKSMVNSKFKKEKQFELLIH